jgi:thiol:disulfide interchange protein DsbC
MRSLIAPRRVALAAAVLGTAGALLFWTSGIAQTPAAPTPTAPAVNTSPARATTPPAGEPREAAAIRRNLPERLSQFPAIDEVRATPMAGVFEVRINGTELVYTNADGSFLLQGQLIDVTNRKNLTAERVERLTAVKFDDLPLKDAFVVVKGNGKRKFAAFHDPNCGFCKRLEVTLQNVNDYTMYVFLYPILSKDSSEKAEDIWCARDRERARIWTEWMVNGRVPPDAKCSGGSGNDLTALERNTELGRRLRVTGTPTLIFPDGTRVPGALPAKQLEEYLLATNK